MSAILTVALTIEGPLLVRSQDAMRVGLDAHGGIDTAGRAYIPGSHIKGQIRHAIRACVDLLGNAPGATDAKAFACALGDVSPSDSRDKPERARLRFPDRFVATVEATQHRTLHRIRMHDDGRVDDGALLVLQSPLAPGEKQTFVGELRLDDDPTLSAAEAEVWLRRTLALVPAVGSLKGVGYGRILAVEVSHRIRDAGQALVVPPSVFTQDGCLRVGLQFELDRPFCFARPTARENNRFESENHVPGAALLAALLGHAKRLSEQSVHARTVVEHAEAIRFGHAYPLRKDTVPVADLPLPILQSWVQTNTQFEDVALCESLTPTEADGWQAPAFATDWKDEAFDRLQAAGIHIRSAPPRELRVRTAIDQGKRSADEGKLFATECVVPDGYDWACDLTLLANGDNSTLLEALRHLLPEALYNLGKTKAEVSKLRWCHPFHQPDLKSLQSGDTIILELHSAAALPVDDAFVSATGGAVALRNGYKRVFAELSENSLDLQRHFATQHYVGGSYLQARFWSQSGRACRPLLLTDAGSVFVLKVVDAECATRVLRAWAMTGLPVGDTEKAKDTAAWQLNPYRAANGYGDIRIRTVATEQLGHRRPLSELPEYRA